MSDEHSTAPAVESGAHDEHHPYVNYWMIFVILCGLTGVSWLADKMGDWNLLHKGIFLTFIVLAVACAKAMFVMLYFMHLKFEGKWKFVLLAPTIILAMAIPAALMPDIGSHYYDYAASAALNPTKWRPTLLKATKAPMQATAPAEHGPEARPMSSVKPELLGLEYFCTMGRCPARGRARPIRKTGALNVLDVGHFRQGPLALVWQPAGLAGSRLRRASGRNLRTSGTQRRRENNPVSRPGDAAASAAGAGSTFRA